ncbi:hypothetical protein NQ317_014219 [Molorchus minor]|uniref:Phosphotransferase n=1 Tax=Molorchus minor TaxID=1323400 RepID=A0ABQ9JDH2_9CUCU|nr:hypothetical protein NQ317_014219 [Molorchus minor]
MSGCKSKICNPPIGVSGDPTGVSPEIIEACKELNMTNDQLKQYMDSLLDNIQKGLKKETNATAIVKCFPTFVQDIPDGTEKGQFLALDLGGSNFRVLYIELGGQDVQKFQIFVIPDNVRVGSGDKLFDFIAEALANYANELGVADKNLPLGFTFSFPLKQVGLEVGLLERWTKGFDCPDTVGKDVVELLKNAIAKRGDVQIKIAAVLNDTTGTLLAAAYKYPDTKIGLILGTGTNACYIEKQSEAELFDEPDRGSGKNGGAFGDDGALDFVRTDYDKDVDANSLNPGKQLHEKMISGMYLGELVRLATERFTKEGKMFGGQASNDLSTRGKFETRYVSEIEWDPPGDFTNVKKVCEKLGLSQATEEDYLNLKYICSCFSRRAAHLVSAGLATIINKMGEKTLSVGIDGTLYRLHPQVKRLMEGKIKELVDPGIQVKLVLSEDGSGKGAAMVAAVAAKNDT